MDMGHNQSGTHRLIHNIFLGFNIVSCNSWSEYTVAPSVEPLLRGRLWWTAARRLWSFRRRRSCFLIRVHFHPPPFLKIRWVQWCRLYAVSLVTTRSTNTVQLTFVALNFLSLYFISHSDRISSPSA